MLVWFTFIPFYGRKHTPLRNPEHHMKRSLDAVRDWDRVQPRTPTLLDELLEGLSLESVSELQLLRHMSLPGTVQPALCHVHLRAGTEHFFSTSPCSYRRNDTT